MLKAETVDSIAPNTCRNLAIVDDDPLFRESLAQNLVGRGYQVEEFSDGESFLARLREPHDIHLILLDWKMPRMNGIEVLGNVRQIAPNMPVIFLTVLSDQIYEEAALLGGAVDFVEKSRSFSIIVRRIELAPFTPRNAANSPEVEEEQSDLSVGALQLDLESHRAYWKGEQVYLTLSEFGIVKALASKPGTDLPYRRIYDVVHGYGFIAGDGENGYRANVRSLIKRIRQKFRSLDPDFDHIENYAGFGYRWQAPR